MTAATNSHSPQRQLFEAAERGDSGVIRQLAMDGVDMDTRNADGLTAFSIATRNNHADAAMTILAAKEMQFMRSIGLDDATDVRQQAQKIA